MSLTILYFAAVADLVGTSEERIDVPGSVVTVGDLSAHLVELHPRLREHLRYVRFARNEVFADAASELASGDVVAVLPPVAGG